MTAKEKVFFCITVFHDMHLSTGVCLRFCHLFETSCCFQKFMIGKKLKTY